MTELENAIAIAKSGDKATARKLLNRLVIAEPNNEMAWMWLAWCATTRAERSFALERVLKINPRNDKARAILVKIDPRRKLSTWQRALWPLGWLLMLWGVALIFTPGEGIAGAFSTVLGAIGAFVAVFGVGCLICALGMRWVPKPGSAIFDVVLSATFALCLSIIGLVAIPETDSRETSSGPTRTMRPTLEADVEMVSTSAIQVQTEWPTMTATPRKARTSTPRPTPRPTTRYYPTATRVPTRIPYIAPSSSCCKHCGSTSKPCGDSCISKSYQCHKPAGCACP